MKRNLVFVKAAVFLLAFCISGLFAQGVAESSTDVLNFKRSYENELRVTIENVLTRTIGADKATVTVVVDVSSETERKKKSTYTKPVDDDAEGMLVPGIPMPPSFKSPQKNEEIYETVAKPKINSVYVSLFIDKSVDEKTGDSIKDTVKKTVGIANSTVDIKWVKFAATSNSSDFLEKNKVLLTILIVIIGLIAFLFGPVRSFMKNILKTMAEGKGRDISIDMGGKDAAGALGAGGAGAAGAMAPMGGGGMMQMAAGGEAKMLEGGSGASITLEKNGETRVFKPFSFIKKANMQNLVYLIQQEPPEIVSLIMTYLSQEEAAEVMTALPLEQQAKVALAMAQVKQATAESVIKAEEEIKKKIDFLVGGVERFIGILDRLDKTTRDEILEALEKESPALADRIRKEVFAFENVVDLEDAALQLVLREIKTDVLAKALTSAPVEIVEKVKKNISAGAQTLLQEEMNLVGYLTPMQIEEERSKLLNSIKKLEKEGKISIGKGKNKRMDKIGRIEKLDASLIQDDDDRAASAAGGETGVSGENAQGSNNYSEKKVSIKDYEGKNTGKVLSMVNIFRQVEAAGPEKPETGKASQKEEEGLFVSKKAAPTQGVAQATNQPVKTAAPVGNEDMTTVYNRGITAYKEKRFDDAIRDFTKCLALNPNLWQMHQFLGNCYFAKKNMVETVRAYQKSLSLNPNNPQLAAWMKDYAAKNKTAT